ncbi:MAG: hypothetical protein QW423_03190 [Candidatus Aenigmatarchaeota archaeon]
MEILKRGNIIPIILLSGFIFAVSFSTLYAQTHIIEGTACSCTLPIPILIPTFASLGLLIGSTLYYFMSPKIGESKEKQVQLLFSLIEILNPEEREIMKKILENKGEIFQNKLSRTFGKVKTFRVLENLRRRGVIDKESYGKTNIIRLNEKIRRML